MRRTVALSVSFLVSAALAGSTATAAAPAIAVVRPADGSVVTGTVALVAETDGTPVAVTFTIARSGSSVVTVPATQQSATRWRASWGSGEYDGPATIRATSSDPVPVESAPVTVRVDNVAPVASLGLSFNPFSPNRDGRKDTTRIRAGSSEPADLLVRLKETSGRELRRWSLRQAGSRAPTIEWGGRAEGRRVADGRYRLHLRVTDAAGLTGTTQTTVIVDTRAPGVRITGLRPDLVSDQERLRIAFRTGDRSQTVGLRLDLSDSVGRVGRKRARVPTGEGRMRWRPRYADGGLLFPGNYRARLVATDDAGNRRVSKPVAWRVQRSVTAQVYTRLQAAGRRVALTFDDCHYPGAWASILATLKSHRVKAAFFCPGGQVRANPRLARRTVRAGHTAAAHAWDHANLAGKGFEYTASRLRADASAWWEVAGATSAPYFRPPYGAYDSTVVAAAGATSHPRVMMWDVDPLDWQRPGSSAIASRVIGNARPGSVILMHTLDQTAEALPAIIRGLRDKGLRPVPLPRLFRAAGLR